MSEEIVQEEEVVVEEESVEEKPATEPVEEEAKEKDPYAELTHEEAVARLKKADKAILKHKKPAQPAEKPITKPDSDEIPEWGQKILATEDKRKFGYDRKLAPDTVDAVFQFNGGKTPTEETMEHPAVKAIIKSMEAANRVAANTPRGGTAPTYKGKTYAETVTNSESSKDDKQAAFEAARKKHGIQ